MARKQPDNEFTHPVQQHENIEHQHHQPVHDEAKDQYLEEGHKQHEFIDDEDEEEARMEVLHFEDDNL